MDMEGGWEKRVGRLERTVLRCVTLLCAEQIASGKLPYRTGSSAWCSAMT